MAAALVATILLLTICLVAVRLVRWRRVADRSYPSASEPAIASQSDAVPVCRVVDGDTIKLPDGRTVRLLGFDAPETWRPEGVSAHEMALGMVATERLHQLVSSGAVRLRLSGRPDKYGRLLGTMTVNGRDVAETMIEEGHARRYDGGKRLPW